MSNKYRIARLNVSLSQEQAAKKLGIHVTTLNKYENDHRDPSADVVRKMATIYSVSVDKLLDMTTTAEDETMYRIKYEDAQEQIIKLQQTIIELKTAKKERPLAKKKSA